MTQEEKQLLLKDLCARLPYYCHFKVRWGDEDYNILDVGFGRVTLVKPFMSITSGSPLVEEVKPYLRPMSSMSKSEWEEYKKAVMTDNNIHTGCVIDGKPEIFTVGVRGMDFLNEHCFDYRDLIQLGLALKAPEGMYEF